jgi:hypothetical protein
MADIVTGQIFSTGEKNITAIKLNNVIGSSVIQPAFVGTKPVASGVDPADNLLLLTKGGPYAQVPFQTVLNAINAQLPTASDSEIWNVRLKSFNAIGNPSFEIDQRNVGNAVANANGFVSDRWSVAKAGTLVLSGQQVAATAGDGLIPGTNFKISRSFLRVTLTTAQATLGATDTINIAQSVEGPSWRELSSDVHSVSLLVRSSVAGFKFSVRLCDVATTKSLVKLCTIPSAGVWTLIQLPNLPVWPAGNFVSTPGAVGYSFLINLGAGTTYTAPAADTWQNGTFNAAPGASNFASNATGATFDVAFVQHEPGATCSTFIDKPFTQNLDECLRYFQKSWPYATAVGGAIYQGAVGPFVGVSTTAANGGIPFPKRMAKAPTVAFYAPNSGAANACTDGNTATALAMNASVTSEGGIFQLGSTAITAGHVYSVQFTADTGW